jgi:hypothetical protein
MWLALSIGIPVFLVFGGLLLALAFHGPEEENKTGEVVAATERPQETFPEWKLVVSGPAGVKKEDMVFDQLVGQLEAHLREEFLSLEGALLRQGGDERREYFLQ